MSEPDKPDMKLSPPMEGLVGAGVGVGLGVVLHYANVISAPAIIGIAIGVGLGSWFNAWRRGRKEDE